MWLDGSKRCFAGSVGDRVWRERVASHHEVIRKALDVYRGREVDTAGDGFFATFDGPGRAVACARSIGRWTAAARD